MRKIKMSKPNKKNVKIPCDLSSVVDDTIAYFGLESSNFSIPGIETMQLCMLELYHDSMNEQLIIHQIKQFCSTHLSSNYCGIYHNMDRFYGKDCFDESHHRIHEEGELKKPHYHIVVEFGYQQNVHDFLHHIGLEGRWCKVIPPKKIEQTYLYLTHITKPNKYQYGVSKLFGGAVDYVTQLNIDYANNHSILSVLNYVEEQTNLNRACTLQSYMRRCYTQGRQLSRNDFSIVNALIREQREIQGKQSALDLLKTHTQEEDILLNKIVKMQHAQDLYDFISSLDSNALNCFENLLKEKEGK